jgi:hypothetical protein
MRCEAAFAMALPLQRLHNAKLNCSACLAGKTGNMPCRTGKPGLGPAADLPLLLRQKT